MTKADLLADLKSIAGRLTDDDARKTAADASLLGYLADPDVTDAWIAAGGAKGRQPRKNVGPMIITRVPN